MSQLVRELKRKRDEEARLAQRSPLPVFQETEGGQTIKAPEQVVVEAVTALNNLKNAVTLQAGDNVTVTVNGQTITITGPTPGAEVFLGLEDTPGTYIGEAGRVVKVNSMEDGLEFADESGGGGSYTLPQATESTLGGIKAAEKTAAETTPVKIDPATGILYVPPAGAAANGLPAGGTEGQVLAKNSDTDFDTEWIDAPTGDGSGTPSGDGREDTCTEVLSASSASFSGLAVCIEVLENIWITAIQYYMGSATDTNVTVTFRTYGSEMKAQKTGVTLNTGEWNTVVFDQPIYLAKNSYYVIEILYSSAAKLYRKTSYLYSGTLWKMLQNRVNSYFGATYSETPGFGLIEYDDTP